MHIIGKYGIRVNPSKTDALRNAREPKNVEELQSFTGGVNYYSKFIPDMATITKPLYLLLQKNMNWEWGDNRDTLLLFLKEDNHQNLPSFSICETESHSRI